MMDYIVSGLKGMILSKQWLEYTGDPQKTDSFMIRVKISTLNLMQERKRFERVTKRLFPIMRAGVSVKKSESL